MAPVAVPPQRVNDDARIVLRMTRRALESANDRLGESRRWYGGVREAYARP